MKIENFKLQKKLQSVFCKVISITDNGTISLSLKKNRNIVFWNKKRGIEIADEKNLLLMISNIKIFPSRINIKNKAF